MGDYGNLAHSRWDCKYHVVFIPKYRKNQLFGQIRSYLGPVFHELAQQKESKILEGAHDGRSRTYVHFDSTEVLGGAGDRIQQGEERHQRGSAVWGKEEKFQRGEHVGEGIRGLHHWI